MEKIVLIDGHSILNRAYYGVPDLTNASGLHTNAIYGFLNIMFKILDEENPKYLTVAFDVKAPTFRHLMYKEYKGTRKPMDEELRQQVPVMKEVLKAMGIKVIEFPGFEADDILGTLAKKGEKEGYAVSLVSGDRDLLQIASDVIKIRIPKTKGGKTEIEDYYATDVLDKYQVDPKGFIELKALMGDTADNIPGVPKVGEKTATELMVTYKSLQGIYEHVEEISKKAVKESLIANKDLAYLSLDLATIKTDVELDYSFEDAIIGNFYTEEAYKLFKTLEFKNMLSRFETKVSYEDVSSSFRLIEDYTEASDFVAMAVETKEPIAFSLVVEDNNILGLSISLSDSTAFIKKWMFIGDEFFEEALRKIGSKKTKVSTHRIKSVYGYLQCDKTDCFDDVIIGAYLNNPLKSDYSLNDIANEYLGMLLPEKSQLFKKINLSDACESNSKDFLDYVCFNSYVCLKASNLIEEKLRANGEYSLYREIEMPLSLVLYHMEKEGIRVVPSKLNDYSKMLGEKIEKIEEQIYKAAGEEFNINSPKQLGEILFEKMGIPGGKKTKTGYSTAADVLEKLSGDYPIVNDILEFRAYSKLKSTYADGLMAFVDANDRIHSNFQQTVTATGRLSSTDPNLQNIPIRMELGRQIRKVFVPKDGCVFMDADYSQIELRVLASLAQDEKLIKAYSEHADIHRITASQVFHVPFDEVTDLQRRNAKAVNFGIVYGISAFGLGEDLGISRAEAKKYIEDYFATFPKIKTYLDETVENAKKNGYSTTYFGRRRPIPELSASNFMVRGFGERVAMNSPIQGTAADIIKIAMIRVFDALKKEGLKSKLILQIHDELLIEVYEDEVQKVEEIMRREMVGATNLDVKMEIDLHTGYDWFEAK